tara:strand:+ start:182 stop:298 length:117 start_codon:yes stop_codon:yes gene_type:complete
MYCYESVASSDLNKQMAHREKELFILDVFFFQNVETLS